jgi:hypothetical protein
MRVVLALAMLWLLLYLWIYRAAQGRCLRIGDVDAFPALKSRIKGR